MSSSSEMVLPRSWMASTDAVTSRGGRVAGSPSSLRGEGRQEERGALEGAGADQSARDGGQRLPPDATGVWKQLDSPVLEADVARQGIEVF